MEDEENKKEEETTNKDPAATGTFHKMHGVIFLNFDTVSLNE